MIKRIVRQALLLVVLLTTVASASSMQAASGKGEIVITCQNCEASSTDVFSQSWYNVVQAFNRTYTGKYRVQVQHYGGTANDLQYLERLELAGALPDIFVAQSTILQILGKGGGLLNVAPYLAKDPTWKNSFYPDSF